MTTWTDQQLTALNATLCTVDGHKTLEPHHHRNMPDTPNCMWDHEPLDCEPCQYGAPIYAHPIGIANVWWDTLTGDQKIQIADLVHHTDACITDDDTATPEDIKAGALNMCRCHHLQLDHFAGSETCSKCTCSGFTIDGASTAVHVPATDPPRIDRVPCPTCQAKPGVPCRLNLDPATECMCGPSAQHITRCEKARQTPPTAPRTAANLPANGWPRMALAIDCPECSCGAGMVCWARKDDDVTPWTPIGAFHTARAWAAVDMIDFDVDTILNHFDTSIAPRLRQVIRDAATKHGVCRRQLGVLLPGDTSIEFNLPELQARNDRDDRTPTGASWMNLAFEELTEASTAPTPAETVAEALQTIQVLVGMITDIENPDGEAIA